MSPSRSVMLPLPLLLLGFISGSLACHCDRYPWTAWSACTRTCNYGTQTRNRNVQYDDYYWKNSCPQMCARSDTRGCNQQACPINCVLSEFSQWSDCSPCARKQFRTRSVVRPSQFGGSECSVELTEERPCYPSKECQLPPVDCRGDFKCGNGRCINSTLTCNKQNDCGDNSDERDCGAFSVVCPSERRPAPGVDLVGNGFDFLAEEPRGGVLDNMFMGGSCIIRRPQSTLLYHRMPYNFKTFDIKVGVLEDFSTDPQPVVSEPVVIKRSEQREQNTRDQDNLHILFFYGRSSSSSSLTSSKAAFEASKKKDSKFFRVHQLLPISNFTVKDPQDLVHSLPFLQFLHALPLDYNYALYREIFQRFGTHYYSSGKLGGHYDLLYHFGEDEEFQCFTGFELEGFQFINCQPDGTWSQPRGRCISKFCVAPEAPENMVLYPSRETYRVGQSVGFNCNETGLMPMPRGLYRCSSKLTWEPPLPADLHCTDVQPFVPDGQCGPGQKRQRSGCVCIERESCLSQSASLCVLNVNLGVAVSMSLCSFHAGRCHGDPLFYISEGVCNSVEPAKLERAKFRAKMSPRSSLHVPCDLDTCYDWETCSASKKCQCKAPLDCPKTSDQMFCVKLKPMQMIRSISLCALGAISCSGFEYEILNEGICQSR
uniref:Complement component 6, duplicate 1 n=1 Tax=Xiphophorus couchianus TaxID=32473 RepID=A0A3B5LCZ8_9TELE